MRRVGNAHNRATHKVRQDLEGSIIGSLRKVNLLFSALSNEASPSRPVTSHFLAFPFPFPGPRESGLLCCNLRFPCSPWPNLLSPSPSSSRPPPISLTSLCASSSSSCRSRCAATSSSHLFWAASRLHEEVECGRIAAQGGTASILTRIPSTQKPNPRVSPPRLGGGLMSQRHVGRLNGIVGCCSSFGRETSPFFSSSSSSPRTFLSDSSRRASRLHLLSGANLLRGCGRNSLTVCGSQLRWTYLTDSS